MQAVSGVRSMESLHKPLVILRCKLVVIGDACVGKTALTQVFHSGGSTYPKNYLMTTGAEFCVKQVPLPGPTELVIRTRDNIVSHSTTIKIVLYHNTPTRVSSAP